MFNILSGAKQPTIDSTLLVGLLTFAGMIITLLWTVIWSIISSRQQQKGATEQRKETAENTKQLHQIQKDLTLNNRLHDQSKERLHEARKAAIETHKAHLYLLLLYQIGAEAMEGDGWMNKSAELSAHHAELIGIAVGTGDPKLIELTKDHNIFHLPLLHLKNGKSINDQKEIYKIGLAGNKGAVAIHQRITELIEEASRD